MAAPHAEETKVEDMQLGQPYVVVVQMDRGVAILDVPAYAVYREAQSAGLLQAQSPVLTHDLLNPAKLV